MRRPTPGRPSGRSGVLLSTFLAVVSAAPLLGGCDAVGGGATIQLDSAEVQLDGGARAHEIRITGFGGTDSIAPAMVEAKAGDAVRFVVGDGRAHALAFRADALEADARAFLERTGQLRGPPLVNEGAEWVVTLQEAPAGRYPYHCRSHDATGTLVVRPED